jgi:hypothetical protein
MCLLTYLPAGTLPDTDALANGAILNEDGHGFAIVAGRRHDQLIVEHGLNAEALIDAFAAARARHPEGPALFHSRFSTHGTVTLDNCHPFPLGGDQRTVLAHNGILPRVVQPARKDPRSDTRIAAEQFIPAFGNLRTRRTRLALQRWMTKDNKMVILTIDRRFKQRSYLLNEQSGTWDGGIWYSNDGYLPMPANQSSAAWPAPDESWDESWDDSWDESWDGPEGDTAHGATPRRWRWPSPDQCGNCAAAIGLAANCRHCGWCADCGEMPERCFCYAPAALDTATGATRGT